MARTRRGGLATGGGAVARSYLVRSAGSGFEACSSGDPVLRRRPCLKNLIADSLASKTGLASPDTSTLGADELIDLEHFPQRSP